jgi:hypothetical protein
MTAIDLGDHPKVSVLIDVFQRCVPDAATRRKILVDNPTKRHSF